MFINEDTNAHNTDYIRKKIMDLLNDLYEIIKSAPEGEWPKLIRSRYSEIDSIYMILEKMAEIKSLELCDAIFDSYFETEILPTLYAFRSAFEYIEEVDRASYISNASNTEEIIRQAIDHRVQHLGENLLEILSKYKNILFVGSGPLPITPLTVSNYLKKSVTCIDQLEEANIGASDLLCKFNIDGNLRFITADILNFDALNDYDVIFCAFLVGVSMKTEVKFSKSDFVRKLLPRIGEHTTLILRTTHHMGGLIYPRLNVTISPPLKSTIKPSEIQTYIPYNRYFTMFSRNLDI